MLYWNGGSGPRVTQLYVFDPTTLAYETTINVPITDSFLSGLTGDPDLGVLFAVGQVGTGVPGRLYEIDPTTGDVLAEADDNNQGLNEQDIAYANGTLIVSATSGLGDEGGTNVLQSYDPTTFAFIQSVPVATQGFVSGLGGDGLGGVSTDWYSFNVNAGDNLVISTTTPGAPSASGLQFANDLDPTINLYDDAGNLVATATGNASDGRNDVIDWTALTSGSYRVQILGATKASLGEYTISVTGDTGGLAPFTVTSTNPAAGSDIGFQVSSMDVSFSSSVLLASINDSDFTIDGNEATGFKLDNATTVTFTFPTTSDGIHNVSISGVENLQGTVVVPDNFTFETDDVPPVVVSSSIPDGAVLSPGPLTEVITFSKPIQPSSANDSDIILFGEVRGIEYTPSSISFDPTDTILTITYSNIPVDAYEFVLEAGPDNFLSQANVPLQNSFVINFTVPAGTSTISGLTPVLPLGSLVYNTTIDNLLLSSTDTDTYDLSIDPQQTLGVVATPVTSGMKVTVTLISPTGHVIGTATSPTAGAPAVLPAVQSSAGGTYQIVITGGPGEYKVEPVLNAFIDPASFGGTPNGSIATATPIDPYANKFAGNDDRTAVLGTITAGATAGEIFATPIDGSGDIVGLDPNTGQEIARFLAPEPPSGGPDGLAFDVLCPLVHLNGFTGPVICAHESSIQTLGSWRTTLPVTDSSGNYDGLGALNGLVYIEDYGAGQVLVFNPSIGSVVNVLDVNALNPGVSLVGGLSGIRNPDALIGLNNFGPQVLEIDPNTGLVTQTFNAPGQYYGVGALGGEIYLGRPSGGTNPIDVTVFPYVVFASPARFN